jgi:hypothetical protein
MFEVIVKLEKIGSYSTFKEAFTIFYKEIQKIVKENECSVVLESACWIRTDFGVKMFYDAKEYAIEQGILSDNGKLIEN